jgi:fructoselysine-6-P-deglycase FrlB-like protein
LPAGGVIGHGQFPFRGLDGLIGFSTSGNSENILAAFAAAKRIGAVTLGLAGYDGGKISPPSLDLDQCAVLRDRNCSGTAATRASGESIIIDPAA